MSFRLNDNRPSGYKGSIERPYDYPYDPNREFGGRGRISDYPRPRPRNEDHLTRPNGRYGD